LVADTFVPDAAAYIPWPQKLCVYTGISLFSVLLTCVLFTWRCLVWFCYFKLTVSCSLLWKIEILIGALIIFFIGKVCHKDF